MKKINSKEVGKIFGGNACYCIAPNGERFRNGATNNVAQCRHNCKNNYGNDFEGTFNLYNQDQQVECFN